MNTQSSASLSSAFAAWVRDLRSMNTSTSSNVGIPKSDAAFSKVSKLGDALPLNQSDQYLIAIPVSRDKSLYEKSKNFSLLLVDVAYIRNILLSSVSNTANALLLLTYRTTLFTLSQSTNCNMQFVAQSTKHPHRTGASVPN